MSVQLFLVTRPQLFQGCRGRLLGEIGHFVALHIRQLTQVCPLRLGRLIAAVERDPRVPTSFRDIHISLEELAARRE